MEQKTLKYPIGIQNFQKLREEGFLYVDKTAFVYQLAQQGGYYFLGRPRRFGKSLLLSTIEAYFEGKKELFEGLAIEKLEKEWQKYPVLHLDLNASQYRKEEDLLQMLNVALVEWEKTYGRESQETTPSTRFAGIIRRAYKKTGKKVVILVDEYDKPLVMNIDDEKQQDTFRDILKAFYGVMKSSDQYIRMGFLTGVTKFSKISVFSDLNNIEDISTDKRYATICGMTEEEIHNNLDSSIAALAESCGIDKDKCYAELRRRYDGYRFHQDSVGIYNPFSLLLTISKQEFGDYWFETGTPTQLITIITKAGFCISNLDQAEITSQQMRQSGPIENNPLPVLFQSGYLTIKDYDKEFDLYTLGFPNEEVENSFMEFLMPLYSNIPASTSPFSIQQFVKEIRNGQPEAFMNRLAAIMADTDYRIVGDSELYFQNFCYVFFRLLGIYTEVERATNDGRMDMVIQTKDYIYIIEFKLNQTAASALRQIDEKGYAAPFAADSRILYKIGINFNLDKRTIDDWIIEKK